jgi:L-aminopeptidase/D-esterase-like protein
VSPAPTPDPGLTAVAGIRVGHWHDLDAATGCTVVLAPPHGAVASGAVLGGAPGTREIALLDPERTVDRVHAVLLAGGSAFGLDAAGGVVRWLEARGVGFDAGVARVPIVPAAVLFDLGVGRADVRPGPAEGEAAAAAAHDGPVATGRVGAGAGATAFKLLGPERAVRSGLGSASLALEGATVAALVVANPLGAIVDPSDGRPVAGEPTGAGTTPERFGGAAGTHTTLAIVATDAPLDKAGARALATAAHAGIARVVRPSHTPFDGDATFVLSTGQGAAWPPARLAAAVQEVVARALVQGARAGRDG